MKKIFAAVIVVIGLTQIATAMSVKKSGQLIVTSYQDRVAQAIADANGDEK